MKDSIKNISVTLGVMAFGYLLCLLLEKIFASDAFAGWVFMLATAMVSNLTDGYIWGTLAAVSGALLADYRFIYPHCEISFFTENPLAFLVIVCSSVLINIIIELRKKHQKKVAAKERELFKADLMRALSHDIRTPLSLIYTSANVYTELGDSLPEDNKRKLVEGIKQESEWLLKASSNILTVARIDNNIIKLSKKNEAAEEIIAEVIGWFLERHPDIKIVTSVPQELVLVPMDAQLFTQAVKNLLDNCVVHGKGMSKISLRLYTNEKYAVTEIRDDGCGFDEEILPLLFKGLFTNNTSDSSRNLGLGLKLCKEVARLHGGKIKAYNDGGAVVELILPLSNGGKS